MLLGILLLGIGIGIPFLITYIDLKSKMTSMNNLMEECKSFNLKEIFCSSPDHILAFTEDKKMFFVYKGQKILLDYKDLLKIDVEYKIKQKHKEQIVSILPTVNTYTEIVNVQLVIITMKHTYRFYYTPKLNDKIERYKLMAEKYKEEGEKINN